MKWHHNVYDEETVAEMQNEAERRVRSMQERRRLLAPDPSPLPPPPASPPRPGQRPAPRAPGRGGMPDISGMAGQLGLSDDGLIVLALLWLLWNEHADRRLMLALLYLLL